MIVDRDILLADYLEFVRVHSNKSRDKMDPIQFTTFLKKVMDVPNVRSQPAPGSGGAIHIELRPLDGCRKAMSLALGAQIDWGSI